PSDHPTAGAISTVGISGGLGCGNCGSAPVPACADNRACPPQADKRESRESNANKNAVVLKVTPPFSGHRYA
ncbi:MAG: hypothetical protein ACSLFH_16215, partial [Desulfuromonadales bacterium]